MPEKREKSVKTTCQYIFRFDELDKDDIAIAGGKGANLGALSRAGFPVPEGFVITTAAYDAFVEANDIGEAIVRLASVPRAEDVTGFEEVSQRIRALFSGGALPEEMEEEIRTAHEQYVHDTHDGQSAFAVRSSATAEDLPGASFAGQQETFLNVRGSWALMEAVRECWASLWTARAIAYRERQGVDHEAVSMGVVVQTMVSADVSGILFTANPATGARDELVVDAGFGLGEAIVSGEITPDTYVLDRESLVAKETQLGTKEAMVVAADGQRTISRDVPEARRGEPALSEALLGELAALGVRVEEHFDGVPQDVEWAVADGSVWLLQARPITNLPPAPLRDVRWEPPRPGSIWMRRQVVEHMPEPLSPLFAELYLEEGLDRSVNDLATLMGDLAGFEFTMWDFVEPPFATTINGYAYSIASFNLSPRLTVLILRIYATALPKMIRHLVPHWRDEVVPAYRATIERWKKGDPADASDEELLRGVHELAVADAVYWFASAAPLGLARITDAVLDRYLKFVADGRDSANGSGPLPTSSPYLRGFPSKALEAQAQLEAIARDIHSSEGLRNRVVATPAGGLIDALAENDDGQAVLEDLRGYLDEYGHQIYNLDFVAPTMADDPLPVLLSLKAAVQNPDNDSRAYQEELARERDALVESTARFLNLSKRRIFRLLLGWAQRYTPYREEALFYVGAAWPTLRKLALELGRRLAEAGSLDTPDDVFFLKTAELDAASAARVDGSGRPELARLARERRELREARKRLDPPTSVPPGAQLKFGPIRLSMFEPQPSGVSEGPTLNGSAVSPGRVTAPASIIRSPEDFDEMTPGTILVCPTTTPAWTPLFSQAKGLVTDIGGALAHGSIVAREYGIPAVMGTGAATRRIESGQLIQVNGDSGTVTLVEEAGSETAEAEAAQPAKKRANSSRRRKAFLALAAGAAGLMLWRKIRGQHARGNV